ncbi:MAG: RNA polymerase subunit sigma-70 [Rheinheimera sp.]|uniref:sigma-70 family RNA polymerase sigma factor n=1 Tax=Arsukibacterium sp. UBA3155 TaxID=1946058 RepID=UPI000C8BB365|nr:sigma-70 family RNA polymerase sigma factor [Arsukibacterium sp. UBA3155]MAD76894.1 RNA polymerase subunit sigma-70 [Rheinheimera sp.]|tara:strand:- start:10376 stop:10918 length:543 start_codon:yes stop_codon:yes gene_type:complete
METTQQQLLEWLYATANGNRAAFEKLYQASSGKLFSVSLHLLRRHDWAEDVLQDAFVRIWHNAADYHAEKGTVMTWMISITRYRALDLLKSRRIKAEHLDVTDELPDEVKTGEVLGLTREKVKLDDCMEALVPEQRQSIQLAYLNGLSHHEITEHTGSPLGTVKSWIRRGLTQLKRCLEG